MITPNGCFWCEMPQRGHFQRWCVSKGWHVYARPTNAQIKRRMLERREARGL